MTGHRHDYRYETMRRELLGCWGCEQKWPIVPTYPPDLAEAVYTVAHDPAAGPSDLEHLYDRLRYQEGTRAWELWLAAAELTPDGWETLVATITQQPGEETP